MKTNNTTSLEMINEMEMTRIKEAKIVKIALVLFSCVLTVCCFQLTF